MSGTLKSSESVSVRVLHVITRLTLGGSAENPDSSGITTVKEYNFVPSAKLPEVKGISSYTPMSDRTVRFAINVWAGWGPIIYANNGFKPGKVWKTPGGKDFKVELVLIDDPVAMRDAFAAGNLHVGWATLDMVEEIRRTRTEGGVAVPLAVFADLVAGGLTVDAAWHSVEELAQRGGDEEEFLDLRERLRPRGNSP